MSLADKAMLVDVSIGMWGTRKKDKNVTTEVISSHGADNDAGEWSKRLMPKDWLQPLNSIKSAATQTNYFYTSPWLQDGTRILSGAVFTKYTREMQKHRVDWDVCVVDKVLAQYESQLQRAPVRMGSMFNPRDYPTKEQLEKRFYFTITLLPVPVASDWRVGLADGEMEGLREELIRNMKVVEAEHLKALWEKLYLPVKNLADGLKEYTPGQREGNFRSSLIEHIVKIVDVLPDMNCTSDQKLNELANEIKNTLTRFSAGDLKTNDIIREIVQEKAEAILGKMSGYLGVR